MLDVSLVHSGGAASMQIPALGHMYIQEEVSCGWPHGSFSRQRTARELATQDVTNLTVKKEEARRRG